jgi:hypothetical protein
METIAAISTAAAVQSMAVAASATGKFDVQRQHSLFLNSNIYVMLKSFDFPIYPSEM